MLYTPCIQYIHKNKNVKVSSTEQDSNNVSYFEQTYSSYAVECCNPVQYERTLYIMSSNVKTNFRHRLISWNVKENMQHKSMNIIFWIYISLFKYSSPLVHCLFQSYFPNYSLSNILHKLFNMNSNAKCPSIIFNIMSYVKYSIHLVLCQTSVHFNFDQFNIMSYANISTNKHLKQF